MHGPSLKRAVFQDISGAMTFRTPTPPSLLFKGRAQDPRLGEWVRLEDPTSGGKRENICLWGCPDDLGVTRNHGRAGARGGPDSIRKHLYKMTPPMNFAWEKAIELYDAGNLIPSDQIRETHHRAHEGARKIASVNATILVLGGGHDFAAPNFLGFVEGRESLKKKERFGLLNVDPHLDVRELEGGLPHSGSPFREILESGKLPGQQFVEFGARLNRNARHHFDYCKEKKVTILDWESLISDRRSLPDRFQVELKKLAAKCTTLAVTFDMDACADAEGTSAAPVLGFSARELVAMAALAGREKKVRYFELAEVAPSLDSQERSSRIAAEVLYSFLRSRAQRLLS